MHVFVFRASRKCGSRRISLTWSDRKARFAESFLGHTIAEGMQSSIAGGVLRAQEFVLNIHPPAEAPGELQQAMDAIVKLEEVKRASADEAFADEKQKMVDAE